MVASIGQVASPSQGASYYERDGYYAKDDPEHHAASAWAGRGASDLGLEGPVDPDVFKGILAGYVPDGTGTRLGRKMEDGEFRHRPGRDITFSAPKSVSLAALIGGDERVTEAHDRAVMKALDWFERNAAETRMRDPETGRMVRTANQKVVIATFRHDTSRNLDPALHTHSVIANMARGEDGKWRTMANEGLYGSKMLLGALYRNELARGLMKLGYGIEKKHADGRFEIAGVSRETIDAFSTRRAEIVAAVEALGGGNTAANQDLARRAALMTRSHKRDVDKGELHRAWILRAEELGFDAGSLVLSSHVRNLRERGKAGAARKDVQKEAQKEAQKDVQNSRDGAMEAGKDEMDGKDGMGNGSVRSPAASSPRTGSSGPELRTGERNAVAWAMAHLSEREAVFTARDLLTASLTHSPGSVSLEKIEKEIRALKAEGKLHDAPGLGGGDGLATGKAVADEHEVISLMRQGQNRGNAVMRGWMVDRHLRGGPLTVGQKEAVKLILSEKDRTVGVQGYAGTGKTRMLDRARVLAERKGWHMAGLAPSASAARTLEGESGISSETLQRFLKRYEGVAEGRLTRKGQKELREKFKKTVLVVDEGSLASTVQARDLLRISKVLRIPKLVLIGDEKQLDAVDAGKPFAQLQQAGMKTAVMNEILRQRDAGLKSAVEAMIAGNIEKAFEKLGSNVAEVKADNIAGAVAARWLRLSPEKRERTGVMATSHELREGINAHIRERLVREGRIAGPSLTVQRLVSRGYTRAEMAIAENYSPGDVVAFHRGYRRIGVEKGDERRVSHVGHQDGTVHLEDNRGGAVGWKPDMVGGRHGGVEVYRVDSMELRAGDRIRWTRNDRGLGVVNSGTAEVAHVRNGRVSFMLEDGRRIMLERGDPQLRHLDHAWASTVHAFQGRTVDNVIAAMEAGHPHLTTQKSFYVEISRARDRAELVTDDAKALRERLEAVTGERISALEGIGERVGLEKEAGGKAVSERKQIDRERSALPSVEGVDGTGGKPEPEPLPVKNPDPPARGKRVAMDLGL